MFLLATEPSVAAQAHFREARHALDIEMEHVARPRMLIPLHRRRRIQIAPSAEPGTAQNAADRGRAQPGTARDLIAGHVFPAKNKDLFYERRTGLARAAVRTRTAIGQSGNAQQPISANPFRCRLGTYSEPQGGRTYGQPILDHHAGQPLSTHSRPWGILVIVHSVSRVTACSSQTASPVQIEWTTS